jgi:enoyl-CoA hydratase/carnithine racemase
MTKQPHATVTEDDGIITITTNRPEKLNAISREIYDVYFEAVTALGDRDDLRCMVITANGKYFTAGWDLTEYGGNRPANPETQHLHPGWNFRRNYRDFHRLYDEFEAVEKPIVLAAQGICLGAGVEMGMSCDFRFCTPRSEFGVPEIFLGALAGSGGTSRLTKMVGPAWAKYMAMAGQRVSAEQAKTIGLVQDIFPEETFMDDVYAFCRKLIEIPPEVLGLAKLGINMFTDVEDRTVQRQLDRLLVTFTWSAFDDSMSSYMDKKKQEGEGAG